MKQFMIMAGCLLISGASFAQQKAVKPKKPSNKSGVAGTIQDMRRQPVAGIKAFVYKKDSIASSGFSDSAGYFETNYTIPGVYNLKLVYPSDKIMTITEVPVKARTLTIVNFKAVPPAADTSIAYSVLMPQPEQKKKTKI